jgi:hypothetical protein
MTKMIVSVMGATGVQGGSVVDALLKDGSYAVRAITRNTQSDKARALAAKGAQVVSGDANDVSSLVAAFAGSSAIFAVTDFFEPFAKHGAEKAMEVEAQQGINLAKAAAATSTLKHYVWSTLPDGKKVSGGKFLVPHFEAKVKIDAHIKSDPVLSAKTTFLWNAFFASNYGFPMYTPYLIPTAGKYIQIQSTPASVPILSIGDARTNIGIFVKAILEQPRKTLPGKFVLAYAEETTAGDMLQTWARAQGKAAQYVQVDRDTFNALWPGWSEEMGIMMEFWDWAQEKSWSGEDMILTKEDLGVSGLVGVEEAFRAP